MVCFSLDGKKKKKQKNKSHFLSHISFPILFYIYFICQQLCIFFFHPDSNNIVQGD